MDATDSISKDDLRLYQAGQHLLDDSHFRLWADSVEARERRALADLPLGVSDELLRRQFVRWKMSLEPVPDLVTHVETVEGRMGKKQTVTRNTL